MKNIQVTLTVEEGKEVIALGILKHNSFIKSCNNGKILLKGGTTVSRIAEKLIGVPLRISGRITQRGTVADNGKANGAHSIIYNNGVIINIDETIDSEVINLSTNDLIITGANAIDVYGNAAILAGSPGGGQVGKSISSWNVEGAKVIIAVGLEKLIPGNINEIVKKTSRKNKYLSWGMSVGLMPIYGEIFTEIDAIKTLANVNCFVIASGGIYNAQGSITLDISGEPPEIDKIIEILRAAKGNYTKVSGEEESLIECKAKCRNCSSHLGCGYKTGRL